MVTQAMVIRFVGGKPFYAGYGVVLGVVVFLPVLVGLLPRSGGAKVQAQTST